jgi:hypothetical protein
VESGEKVVYGASGVVIVDDIVNHTQRFYNPNSAARVVALALHPDDTTMASCHIHATSTSSSSTSSSSSSSSFIYRRGVFFSEAPLAYIPRLLTRASLILRIRLQIIVIDDRDKNRQYDV